MNSINRVRARATCRIASCNQWRVQKEMIDTSIQTHTPTRHSNIVQQQSYSLWRDERIQALKVKHFVNINSLYIAVSLWGATVCSVPLLCSCLLQIPLCRQQAGSNKVRVSGCLAGAVLSANLINGVQVLEISFANMSSTVPIMFSIAWAVAPMSY